MRADRRTLMSQVALRDVAMANHDPSSEGRTLASSYTTGHKPKETIGELLARVNANSYLGEVPVPPRKPKPPKLHRIAKKAAQLTPLQRKVILDVVEGRRVLKVCNAQTFAVCKVGPDTWSVIGTHDDAEEHTVVGGACSCWQFKTNGACKHLQVLKELR